MDKVHPATLRGGCAALISSSSSGVDQDFHATDTKAFVPLESRRRFVRERAAFPFSPATLSQRRKAKSRGSSLSLIFNRTIRRR
jgi:hypothetical protein